METIPSVDQSKLVAYLPPEKEQMSEKTLKKWANLGGTLGYLTAVTLVVSVIYAFGQGLVWMTSSSWYNEFVPLVSWVIVFSVIGTSFLLMVGGFSLQGAVDDSVERIYGSVPQGMIVKKITQGGGETSLRWVVLIKGFNSLNQLRTEEYVVDAGVWHDQYRVGDYVDFRTDKDKENSLSYPLPEASVGAEM